MAPGKRHRTTRRAVIALVCLALAGGAAAVVIARRDDGTTASAAPPVLKTAKVQMGDLTTTESVDGTLELSATMTVRHRIEGQTTVTPSASSAAPASSQPSNGASNGSSNTTASTVPKLAGLTQALVDCTGSTVPAPTTTAPTGSTTTTSTTTTTTAPPDTSPSTTTTTTTTTTTEPSTTTTTTVPATEAPTTSAAPPPGTVPCDSTPTTTTTTTPTTTPSTAPASGGTGGAGGGSRTGGSGRSSGGSGATSGSGGGTARVTQTITSIIAPNTAIQQGDVLYTADGSPVVALDGALPEWRSLSTSSADGADIAQLEASLVALGYDPEQKVTVDQHFDTATRTMVEAWQTGLGEEATGAVKLGAVVFLPSATTVTGVDMAVGDTVEDGDAVLTLAAPTQQVLITVPSGDEAKVVPGLTVKIGTVRGTVSQLRSATQNGSVVVEAVITPADTIKSSGNGSTVKVGLTIDDNSGVLIVSAEALASKLDGSYAVQVQAADGTVKWVTVELLGVSGGNVAIRGDGVDDGTVVLVPA